MPKVLAWAHHARSRKREIAVNMIALVIFAVIAVVILFQLYNVLGRRVGFRPDEKPAAPKPEGFELVAKPEKPVEAPRIPNLDQLKSRDANFNEVNFVEKARETYEQVVMAYHKGEIDGIKDRLTPDVYRAFSGALSDRPAAHDTLSFVDTPKADIDVIDFREDAAQIRVRFLSELAYEAKPAPAEHSPVVVEAAEDQVSTAVPATKEPEKPQKVYKRTAEYWTFQKGMRNQGNPWVLAKVEAAKA
jgi:predicted lipid-binding transport protein (Tim44 family)